MYILANPKISKNYVTISSNELKDQILSILVATGLIRR